MEKIPPFEGVVQSNAVKRTGEGAHDSPEIRRLARETAKIRKRKGIAALTVSALGPPFVVNPNALGPLQGLTSYSGDGERKEE